MLDAAASIMTTGMVSEIIASTTEYEAVFGWIVIPAVFMFVGWVFAILIDATTPPTTDRDPSSEFAGGGVGGVVARMGGRGVKVGYHRIRRALMNTKSVGFNRAMYKTLPQGGKRLNPVGSPYGNALPTEPGVDYSKPTEGAPRTFDVTKEHVREWG